MANLNFDTLIPRIQGEVPTCPDFIIESRIQETAMDFFRETRIWIIDLDTEPSIQNLADYDIDVNNRQAICEVLWVNYLDVSLEPKTERQLYKLDPAWRTTKGSPKYYTQLSPDTFTIAPVPTDTVSNALSARAAVYPTITAPSMDSAMLNDNYNAIINGTLARLLLMTGKLWYDPSLGAALMQQYVEAQEKAKQRAVNNNVRVVRTVNYGGI